MPSMRKTQTTTGLLALTILAQLIGACGEETGTPRDPAGVYLPEAQIVRPPPPAGGTGGDVGMQGMAGAAPPAPAPAGSM